MKLFSILIAGFLILNSEAGIAKTNFLFLDARHDTSKAIKRYRRAINEHRGSSLTLRIILLVDASKGFDAGILKINRRTNRVDIRVDIYVYNGRAASAPIRVNAIDLSHAYYVYAVNQKILFR